VLAAAAMACSGAGGQPRCWKQQIGRALHMTNTLKLGENRMISGLCLLMLQRNNQPGGTHEQPLRAVG